MRNNNKKLIIYGNIPPPYGGVSLHILRLVQHLEKANISYLFFEKKTKITSVLKFYLSQLSFKRDIIHVFGMQKWYDQLFLLGLMTFCNKEVIVSILNDRMEFVYNSYFWIQKKIARSFFLKVSKLISVNPDTKILFVDKKNVRIISPFIFPTNVKIDKSIIPKRLQAIRNRFKYVMLANAFRIKFFNNQDLYGIDLSIELIRKIIADNRRNIAFIFHISDIREYDYFNFLREKIKEYGLSDNFYFHTGILTTSEYLSLLNEVDLFVRPTNTDGDSISIHEALYLNVQTIASDVTVRPVGVSLFKNRNIVSLYETCLDIIDNYEIYTNKLNNKRKNNSAEEIIELYKKLING